MHIDRDCTDHPFVPFLASGALKFDGALRAGKLLEVDEMPQRGPSVRAVPRLVEGGKLAHVACHLWGVECGADHDG